MRSMLHSLGESKCAPTLELINFISHWALPALGWSGAGQYYSGTTFSDIFSTPVQVDHHLQTVVHPGIFSECISSGKPEALRRLVPQRSLVNLPAKGSTSPTPASCQAKHIVNASSGTRAAGAEFVRAKPAICPESRRDGVHAPRLSKSSARRRQKLKPGTTSTNVELLLPPRQSRCSPFGNRASASANSNAIAQTDSDLEERANLKGQKESAPALVLQHGNPSHGCATLSLTLETWFKFFTPSLLKP